MVPLDLVLALLLVVTIFACGCLQRTPGDRAAVTGAVAMVAYAVFIVAVLQNEIHFSACCLSLAIVIWIHHILIHWESDFTGQWTFCTFQLKDISNHETWIVACVVAGTVFFFSAC